MASELIERGEPAGSKKRASPRQDVPAMETAPPEIEENKTAFKITLRGLASQAARLAETWAGTLGAMFMGQAWPSGWLVGLATAAVPAVGLAGLLAWLGGLLVLKSLGRDNEACATGALLGASYAGWSLGCAYSMSPVLAILCAASGAGAALCALLLTGPLFRAGNIPQLGAPFVAGAWLGAACARALGLPMAWGTGSLWFFEALPGSMASAISHAGSLMFVGNPVSGALIAASAILASPTLAIMCACGGAIGWGGAALAGASGDLAGACSFNGALCALGLGFMAAPSRRQLALTWACIVASSFACAALSWVLGPIGLPVYSAPFVAVLWAAKSLVLSSPSMGWIGFWNDQPKSPELAAMSAAMGAARGSKPGSLALRLPLNKPAEVSQGFDGPHTHLGPWRHAVDFVSTRSGRSFASNGARLVDYYAFGMEVVSPCRGVVAHARFDLPDNEPGALDLANPWGNYAMIAVEGGGFALLAHLRQGCSGAYLGMPVVPGTPLGQLGNSGRSAWPHLHVHAQAESWLGAPTIPFHFAGAMDSTGQLRGAHVPATGEKLFPCGSGETVASAQSMALLPGRFWDYQLEGGARLRVACEIGLWGEAWLVSASGARCRATAGPLGLGLHGRDGPADRAFDAFALAFSWTPMDSSARTWFDEPDSKLLHSDALAGLAMAWRAFGSLSPRSAFERSWDGLAGGWEQIGRHGARATSRAWIVEGSGFGGFALKRRGLGSRPVKARLARWGNLGDHGVPEWGRSS